MNLESSEEQRALRDTVRRYLSEKASVSEYVRPRLGGDATWVDDAAWRGLVGLGATALLVPQAWGGDGSSMADAAVLCEELGAVLFPGPWSSTAVAAPRALARFGAAGDRTAELFGGIVDGSVIVAVATPVAGQLPSLDRHGGAITVRGAAAGVLDATVADVLLLVAAGPNPTLCAVSLTDPAVSVAAEPAIDATRRPFTITLDGAHADPLGVGDDEALEALADDLIIAWAADALGAAERLLGMTVTYAGVRRQFGAPIGSFQAVAHMCVDMYETVELARSGLVHAVWAADSADRGARHTAALRLKAFAGRLATVGDVAIQVFGGIGFTWEHDAHLYLRRLLGFSRFLGSEAGYLERLGRDVVAAAGVERAVASPGDDT